MKKYLKVSLISLASLLLLLILAVSIAIWMVFTPERLTPVVRKQADKYIRCQSEFGKVELTFFSTFPQFGLKLNDFILINKMAGAKSDTLVSVKELVGTIDAKAWWKKKDIILNGLTLADGQAYVFSDSTGHTNYDIFNTDTSVVSEESNEALFNNIDIGAVDIKNVNLSYEDLSMKLLAAVNELDASFNGSIKGDSIVSKTVISNARISLTYGGEQYLNNALVKVTLPAEIIIPRQYIMLHDAEISLNNLNLALNGSIENDTLQKRIHTDIQYKIKKWSVNEVIALVPEDYKTALKGTELSADLSSEGSIKGAYADSLMPMINANVQLENGTVKYSGFALPLHDVSGDILFHSDLTNDAESYVTIHEFKAKTPKSSFSFKGSVDHLLSDMHCSLTGDARILLDEFQPILPADLKTDMRGFIRAGLKSSFRMSDVEKQQFERIKLTALLEVHDLDVNYDSILVKTKSALVDLSMPGKNSSASHRDFLFTDIQFENLRANYDSISVSSGKGSVEVSLAGLNSGDYGKEFIRATAKFSDLAADKIESYQVYMQNADLVVNTSDVRDTTRIPDLYCLFNMSLLSAGMDTMKINVVNPHGKLTMAPQKGKKDQPDIGLSYSSDKLMASLGNNNTANVDKLDLDANISNDNTQKDIFLQWLVKGFIKMDKGLIQTAALKYPLEIPAIEMNFDPENLTIKQGSIIIDNSDFQLTGNLKNVLSYYKGDSILRGKFIFSSTLTDVGQLMNLTSGIGSTEEEKTATEDTSASEGPYMVPKGIDITLTTNVKEATYDLNHFTDIKGDLRVNDGVLVLDGMRFVTPAARMQLTAMYKSPRKNHLYLGIDYHMLNIEIEELLTMIPHIDSIMPMLNSFRGKAEFHIAAETYMDSLYNIKTSTIRGASAIKGNNLVLMDGATFSDIAKKLKFSKKAENNIDTLSAEFTVFKKEIEVYPFLIVMDKYKAVIGGRHDIDMNYNYNISVVDCPLPIKLGIDVFSDKNKDYDWKLGKSKYPLFYRPAPKDAVKSEQLLLRKKIIQEMLASKVIKE